MYHVNVKHMFELLFSYARFLIDSRLHVESLVLRAHPKMGRSKNEFPRPFTSLLTAITEKYIKVFNSPTLFLLSLQDGDESSCSSMSFILFYFSLLDLTMPHVSRSYIFCVCGLVMSFTMARLA